MPLGLVSAYGEQLPRLQAEETLRSIHAQVAASGNMRKPDLDRYLRGLRRDANGGRKSKAPPASRAQLAAMNIKTEGG